MTLALTSPDELAAVLGPASRYLVVADYDGTLAPIVDRPDDAQPAPGAHEALQELAHHTRVAVVSGRPITELQGFLPDLPITLAGGHGAEILDPEGGHHALIDVSDVVTVLDTAQHAVEDILADGTGWFVERKRTSLAVHHRLVPEDEEESLLPRVLAILDLHRETDPPFEVLTGKAVVELRPAGVDKGTALAWLLDRTPDLVPLVVGDDRTDEDAFTAAIEADGIAVLVSEDARPTAATWRLADPSDVVALLRLLTAATGGC